MNRLEHAPTSALDRYHKIGHEPRAIEGLFVELFLEAHKQPPERIVLDLDATDDPLHGHQEGRFFHGYYDGYCYLPLYVFCGRHLLAAKLRRSNIDASAGALDEVERIAAQIRARWPRVKIVLRADSGFARDELMSWCEANGVDYLFGLARNGRLLAAIEDRLAAAEAEHGATGQPARRFDDFTYATLDSWSRERRVVGKAEHLAKGPNPRFVVTSLGAAEIDARTLYEDIYCARGDMENRIKEQQLALLADGTAARDAARQPAAAVLLVDRLHVDAEKGYADWDWRGRTEMARAQCRSQIHLKLLKIGAQVRTSVRRIKVAMASACPYRDEYHLAYLYLKRAAF